MAQSTSFVHTTSALHRNLKPIWLNENSDGTTHLRDSVANSAPMDLILEQETLILNREGSTEMIQTTPATLSAEQEMQALNKTRKRLRSQRFLMAFAIFFSLMPLSFYGNSSEGLVWMMLRDSPTAAGVYFVIGLGFWAAYFLVQRGLRQKGF